MLSKESIDILTENLGLREYTRVTMDIANLEEKIEQQKKQIIIMEKYLELIYDIGFDYDGCNTIEGLKGLIDDLVHCASLGRACNTTEPIYTNMGKHYNILHEEIEGKEDNEPK